MSISKNEGLELHLKGDPNSCFANNYLDFGLKAYHANMNIQPVFIKYKAVRYMCPYWKMKIDVHRTWNKHYLRKKSSKKKLWELHASSWHYENNCQSLLKQSRVFCTVYHILPELRYWRIFLAVYFVGTNPPEERVKTLLCGKELKELPVYRQNIFKKSYIDRYMERPSATFCNGKYCN